MRFDILTLFPAMFSGPLTESILKRAQEAGLIEIGLHDIRAYATDKHRTCDDAPYGGGAGMVMKAVPLAAAIRGVSSRQSAGGRRQEAGGRRQEAGSGQQFPVTSYEQPVGSQQAAVSSQQSAVSSQQSPVSSQQSAVTSQQSPVSNPLVILLTPDGERFSQGLAEELAGYERLVLVCGHYEGVDERVREALIDREISIGDYVLTGGELAAMVVVDAVARLVPGVLDAESTVEESHSDGLLEYPHYTRPAVWEGREVPPVLLSGHHGEVAKWRRQQRLRRTYLRRPDLLEGVQLTKADREYLKKLEHNE